VLNIFYCVKKIKKNYNLQLVVFCFRAYNKAKNKIIKKGDIVTTIWTEMSYRKFDQETDRERLRKEYRSEYQQQENDNLYKQLEQWGYETEDEC